MQKMSIVLIALVLLAGPLANIPSTAYGLEIFEGGPNVTWDESTPTKYLLCPDGDTPSVQARFRAFDIYGNPLPGLNFKAMLIDEHYDIVGGDLGIRFCDPDPNQFIGWITVPAPFVDEGNGWYSWDETIAAGLYGQETFWGMSMMILYTYSGGTYTWKKPGGFSVASPDFNGDGVVNLTDVPLVANLVYGNYDIRADFNFDGEVNLSDVTILAGHIGHSCQ